MWLWPRMTAFFSIFSRLISTANSALRRSSMSGTVSDKSRFNFSYICSVVASAVISIISVQKLQAHIKDFRRMRQSADRNVIHSRAGYFEHIRKRYVARGLELCSSSSDLYGLAHHFERHIIQQDPLNSERQRLTKMIECPRLNFDLDPEASFAHSRHRCRNRIGEIDVVVLY